MNQDYLNRLVGLVIEDFSSSVINYHPIDSNVSSTSEMGPKDVPGYQLKVGPYALTILNHFKLKGIQDLHQSKGLRVLHVVESKDEVIIELQNLIEIVVNLRDEAYYGPEALILEGPGDLIVVWN